MLKIFSIRFLIDKKTNRKHFAHAREERIEFSGG